MTITTIGLDADDTLWENERFYRITQGRFAALLSDHAAPDDLEARLTAAERVNIARYGYGIKGFTLSMIETAISVSEGRVPASVIREILEAGKELLAHPLELLPGVRETVAALAAEHRLVLITKGDLFDQERKLAQSGLGDLFHGVEIVSEKTVGTYAQVFARHGDGPARAMMVGNSMRSDVIPALQAGAWGVHVPHALSWVLEHAEAPVDAPRFRTLPGLGALPDLVSRIRAGGGAGS